MQFRIIHLNIRQICSGNTDGFGEAGFRLNGSGARGGEIGLHAHLAYLNGQ